MFLAFACFLDKIFFYNQKELTRTEQTNLKNSTLHVSCKTVIKEAASLCNQLLHVFFNMFVGHAYFQISPRNCYEVNSSLLNNSSVSC